LVVNHFLWKKFALSSFFDIYIRRKKAMLGIGPGNIYNGFFMSLCILGNQKMALIQKALSQAWPDHWIAARRYHEGENITGGSHD